MRNRFGLASFVLTSLCLSLLFVMSGCGGGADNKKKPVNGKNGSAAGTYLIREVDPIPEDDHVVVQFDKPLDDLRLKKKFGIFRNVEPRRIQFIEERYRFATTADGKQTGLLQLHYEVPASGSYNGWWMKLQNADWSEFAKWDIVLRLGFDGACTRTFKLEIKTDNGNQVFPAIVNLDDRDVAKVEGDGLVDVRLPMTAIVDSADLSRVHELVIVFENTRIPHEYRNGDLLIHSIRFSPATKDAPQE